MSIKKEVKPRGLSFENFRFPFCENTIARKKPIKNSQALKGNRKKAVLGDKLTTNKQIDKEKIKSRKYKRFNLLNINMISGTKR
jgi:hypothetical protein